MAAPTHLLDAADALVLATICTHLDPPGLQAVARAIRAIGNLASLELQRKAIKMLQDYDPDEREDGMLMLKRLGATTRAAIAPTVVQLFEHRHCCVRISAVLALTLLVDASALAAYAPALLDLLDDSYLETCEGALSALKLIDVAALAGKVGNVADEVLGAHEAWTDRMGDELDTRESVHAMRLLELAVTLDHKKMSGRITEVLTSVIYEPDEEVRQAAHSVLARFDAPTRNGLRHILTELFLAHENEAQIQEAAVSAFGLLEGEALAAAAPFMVSVANNLKCSTPTRKMALSMLAKLEPQALAAQAKALLFMLHCGSTVLQCAAAVTLGHLSGEGLAEHAPAMRAMIQYGPEPELLLSACKGATLRAIGCRGSADLP
jgi:HEAT repeat protein